MVAYKITNKSLRLFGYGENSCIDMLRVYWSAYEHVTIRSRDARQVGPAKPRRAHEPPAFELPLLNPNEGKIFLFARRVAGGESGSCRGTGMSSGILGELNAASGAPATGIG